MKGIQSKKINYVGLLIVTVIVIAVCSTAIAVFGQAIDSAVGTVTVGNSTPTVTGIEAVNDTYSIVTAFTPDNSTIFGINVTITDANSLTDLTNVSFWIYDNSIHSGDFASATPNGYDLVLIWWNESNDLWSIDQGAFTEWTMQSPQDPGSASALSSFEFTARFDISRAAYADTDWRFSAKAHDDQDATDTQSVGSDHEMEVYLEISWSASTFAWGVVTATTTNNTMTTNRSLTIRANTQWELQINGSDFTAIGESDEDLQTQDMVIWSENATANVGNSFFLRNTLATGLGTWDNQIRMTATETPIIRNVHLWFQETGDLTVGVEYSITVWTILQANI